MPIPIEGELQNRQLAVRRLLRMAAGLFEMRVRDGEYPEALPDGFGELDPFTDQPMIYRRENGGFILYSVGLDEADGGGVRPEDIVFDARP